MKPTLLIRIVLGLLGGVGLSWFCIPFYHRRILNIGNMTGMIVFTMLMIYSIFMPKTHHFIKQTIRAGGVKRATMVSIGVCLGMILALALLTAIKMYMGTKALPKKNVTVIVLGCKVYGTRPSLMLRERLNAAYKYLNDNPESKCIVSGGKGEGEDISEAEAMKKYLVEKGIDFFRIFKEDQSFNTRENLMFSEKVIKENGLNTDIAIVTNEFHLYRARKIASNLGMETGAISAKTAWWLFPTFTVREMYSILYEWIR